jgi:hypothetical protein
VSWHGADFSVSPFCHGKPMPDWLERCSSTGVAPGFLARSKAQACESRLSARIQSYGAFASMHQKRVDQKSDGASAISEPDGISTECPRRTPSPHRRV